MKTLKSLILAAALMTGTLNAATSVTLNAQVLTSQVHFFAVTQQQVIEYLQATGHTVLTEPVTEDGGYTWTCLTRKRDGNTYFTTVYTDGTNITGHEDVIWM